MSNIIKNTSDWTAIFIQALEESKKIQAAFRPIGFKFDDVVIKMRFDLEEHSGLCIGSRVILTERVWYNSKLEADDWPVLKISYHFNEPCYTVIAFVEPTGYFKGTERNFPVTEIFCVLIYNPQQLKNSNQPTYSYKDVVRKDGRDGGPIAIFWTKGLKLK